MSFKDVTIRSTLLAFVVAIASDMTGRVMVITIATTKVMSNVVSFIGYCVSTIWATEKLQGSKQLM